MKQSLLITEYTDPICNWCYAADPNLRKITYLNSDVELHHVLGLMVKDFHHLAGYGADAEKKFKRIMAQMSAHQGEVPTIANLPHSAKAFAEMEPENMSSYPSSVAVEAMKLLDEDAANLYLRRIREALHSDGQQITDEDVLMKIAEEFPVDQEKFKALLSDGTAARTLEEDVAQTRQHGVRVFPTFHITYGDKRDVFSGYLPFHEFAERLSNLTDGEIVLEEKPFTEENVLDFINLFGRVAEGEVALTFNVSNHDVAQMVRSLEEAGKIVVESSDHGYFVRVKKTAPIQFCDPETGVCHFNL